MGIIILFIDESQYTKIYVFFSNKNFLKMYNLWIFNSNIRLCGNVQYSHYRMKNE